MSDYGRVIAVIPARGGSKGVPRKNLRLLSGKPLIAYTIEAARAAGDLLDRLLVTTDDPEIVEVSKHYGAEVPFIRPAELAGDKVPMAPVLQHAVSFAEAEEGVKYEWVLLLQPTEPFRTRADFEEVLRLAQSDDADSVISVQQVFAVHPILMKRIEGDRLIPFCVEEKEGTRRQDYLPHAFMRNGAFYLTRRDVLMESGSIWGQSIRPYVMPRERSVSIDDEHDLALAEILLRAGSKEDQ